MSQQDKDSVHEQLLGELESIKDILDDSELDDLDIDIPILDDVFASAPSVNPSINSNTNPNLNPNANPYANVRTLDIDALFDDDETIPLAPAALSEAANLTLNFDHLDTDVAIPEFHLDQSLIASIIEPPAPADNLVINARAGVTTPAAVSTQSTETAARRPSNFNLEVLIQELVDEFIPLIEDQLRKRLAACEPEVLRELAQKTLK